MVEVTLVAPTAAVSAWVLATRIETMHVDVASSSLAGRGFDSRRVHNLAVFPHGLAAFLLAFHRG